MKNDIQQLFQWAGKERYKLYLAIISGFVSGLLVIVPYFAIYKLIEQLYYQRLTKEILVGYGIALVAAVVLRYLLLAAGILLSHKGAYNALYRVRSLIIDHMARMPLGHLQRKQSGEMKKVINEDIEKLELFLAHHLPELAMYCSGPIAIFIYLCTVNWVLALVTLAPLPLLFGLQWLMFKRQNTMMPEMNRVLNQLNSSMIEYINGMKLIKAYDIGVRSYKKYADAIDQHHIVWKDVSRKLGPIFAVFVTALQSATILLVPIGSFLYYQGEVSIGTFILFVYVGSMYLMELRPLMELGASFSQVLSGIRNAKEILDTPVYLPREKQFPTNYDIRFDNVSFSYEGNTLAVQSVNLSIRQGQHVAFVGKSGVGKSTLVQLIARFYDVDQGMISIGGRDIREIDYETLLGNISIVFQNTFLTKDSILDNIRMGTKATFEQVKIAAKQAQIDDFIESLPDGYDTKVGSYGSRFSGGERQRIAIARAILKDAPILILDEATSAADLESQRQIAIGLERACRGKTVIIVAHRLQLVKDCDQIIVIEHERETGAGIVTGAGTHGQLIMSNSYYQQAWSDYRSARSISYRMEAKQSHG